MQHEPCGLLSDAEITRDFVAADAVLAVDEHPHRGQPLVETDRAVLENAADLDGELFLAASALPDLASAHPVGRVRARTAPWTFDAVGPAQQGDEGDAGFDVGEVSDRAEQGVGSRVLGSHAPRIAHLAW